MCKSLFPKFVCIFFNIDTGQKGLRRDAMRCVSLREDAWRRLAPAPHQGSPGDRSFDLSTGPDVDRPHTSPPVERDVRQAESRAKGWGLSLYPELLH